MATDIITDRIQVINKKMKQKIRLDIIDLKSPDDVAIGTKIIDPVGPGVTQHAVAAVAEVHRGGIGAVAFLPASGVRDLHEASLELERTVLLASAEDALAGIDVSDYLSIY